MESALKIVLDFPKTNRMFCRRMDEDHSLGELDVNVPIPFLILNAR